MSVRNLSDIQAIESIPFPARGLPGSTYQALIEAASSRPRALALSFFLDVKSFRKSFTWTYGELAADVTRAANAFTSLGVQENDVVAFVLPNLPETHFTIWGGEAAGIAMAVNPLLESGQIADLLRAAKVKVLVTVAPTPGVDLWEKLSPHLASIPTLKHVVWAGFSPYLGYAKASVLKLKAALERRKWPALRISDLRKLMQVQPHDRLISSRKINPSDPSSYFCTGGTTGLPKIAVRTHRSEVYNAWAVGSLMDKPDGKQKTIFCGLPLFHVNGQLVTGLMPWMRGDHVILGTPQGYRAPGLVQRFWDIVTHYRINAFSGVPTLYTNLLQQPVRDGHDLSSLEFAWCGAAPLPTEVFRAFERQFKVGLLEGYGLTEGACASSVNPPGGERRVGSIGLRLPYQNMRAVILDEAGNYVRRAEVDEVGAIAISGPNVFSGYLDDAHNKGIWIMIDGEKWFNTGDLGREDADGYFWLTGRKKELIIRGGHNIDPKQIEEALHGHEAVAQAAAVGMPDTHAGEIPVAYVQLKEGASVSAEELQRFCSDRIAERAAVPKFVRILPQMPVTPVGKIFKPALTMMEIERVVSAEAKSLDLALGEVAVVQDPKKGFVVNVRTHAQAGRDALAKRLGLYAFHVQWL